MALYYIGDVAYDSSYLAHHGIKGMKWGVRRYQNPDGTLTEAGKKRYIRSPDHLGYQPLRGKKGDDVQQYIGKHTIRMERKARKAEEKAKMYGDREDTAKQKAYVEKAKQYLKSAEMDRAMQKAYSELALRDIDTVKRLVAETLTNSREYVTRYLLGQSGYNFVDYKRASKGKPAYQRT